MRYLVRKEHFGAILYDRLEYEYLFCDAAVYSALVAGNKRKLLATLPSHMQKRACSLFLEDRPNYSILRTDGVSDNGYVLSAPLQIYYDVTTNCNLRCKHCYTDSGSATSDELSLPEIQTWAHELASNGVFKISLGGGEPLCHPQWFEIIQAFLGNSISVSLSTNGLLLEHNLIAQLNELNLRTLSISMEGGDCMSYEAIRGPHTWERFVRSAFLLREKYKRRYAIRVTVTRYTLGQVRNILSFADHIGAGAVKFKYIQFEGRALENRDIVPSAAENVMVINQALDLSAKYPSLRVTVPSLASIGSIEHTVNRYIPLSRNGEMPFVRSQFGCGGGHTGLYVSPTGDYSACISMGDAYLAGNLRQVSLSTAWHSGDGMIRMRALDVPRECAVCRYLKKCRGGCRARALFLLGDATAVDPYCPCFDQCLQ